jgi:hypothetical protein
MLSTGGEEKTAWLIVLSFEAKCTSTRGAQHWRVETDTSQWYKLKSFQGFQEARGWASLGMEKGREVGRGDKTGENGESLLLHISTQDEQMRCPLASVRQF